MAAARSGLYDDPEIYDILHMPGTASEVDGLELIERRFVDGGLRLWLEPACGTGRYLREAAGRGIDVIGFDRSAPMVEFARALAPGDADDIGRSEYFVGDMCDFASRVGAGRVTFAFNLINTIRHLPSDRLMLAHLDQVAMTLAPRGVYVVGLSLTAYGCEAPSEDVWTGARGRTRVTQVVQFVPPRWEGNPATRAEQVFSHLTIRSAGAIEDRDSRYMLRTYSLAQWKSLIARSRLRVLASVDEEGRDHEPGDGGYALFVLAR